jgi:hypothetical protein
MQTVQRSVALGVRPGREGSLTVAPAKLGDLDRAGDAEPEQDAGELIELPVCPCSPKQLGGETEGRIFGEPARGRVPHVRVARGTSCETLDDVVGDLLLIHDARVGRLSTGWSQLLLLNDAEPALDLIRVPLPPGGSSKSLGRRELPPSTPGGSRTSNGRLRRTSCGQDVGVGRTA